MSQKFKVITQSKECVRSNVTLELMEQYGEEQDPQTEVNGKWNDLFYGFSDYLHQNSIIFKYPNKE